MPKVALITGISGQDGYYLTKFLLQKGYIVHGIKRRTSLINTYRIDQIYDNPQYRERFYLHYGEMADSSNLLNIISKTNPDELYNLAAQSHVRTSFDIPEYTVNIDALGTLRLLEAIRILGMEKKVRFYQASTSELFGNNAPIPQNESTPFAPCSPYAVAKLCSFWITVNYRNAYGIFASNGILFNHESPLRGETFVTRKITQAVARIHLGLQDGLILGNLNAQRDWGHAQDYVEGMWMMLQQQRADDFVLATNTSYTVRYFLEHAFKIVGMRIVFEGAGLDEVGRNAQNGKIVVRVSKQYYRPTEVENLQGDYSKARQQLGWQPKVSLEALILEMVTADLDYFKKHH